MFTAIVLVLGFFLMQNFVYGLAATVPALLGMYLEAPDMSEYSSH
jgi:uncharacterized membrane protein